MVTQQILRLPQITVLVSLNSHARFRSSVGEKNMGHTVQHLINIKHLELNLFHSKNTSQSIQLTLFFGHCKYSNSCSISPKGKKKLVTAGITTSWLVSMKRLFPIQEYRKSAVADFHEEPWGSKARLPHLGHPNTWMQKTLNTNGLYTYLQSPSGKCRTDFNLLLLPGWRIYHIPWKVWNGLQSTWNRLISKPASLHTGRIRLIKIACFAIIVLSPAFSSLSEFLS